MHVRSLAVGRSLFPLRSLGVLLSPVPTLVLIRQRKNTFTLTCAPRRLHSNSAGHSASKADEVFAAAFLQHACASLSVALQAANAAIAVGGLQRLRVEQLSADLPLSPGQDGYPSRNRTARRVAHVHASQLDVTDGQPPSPGAHPRWLGGAARRPRLCLPFESACGRRRGCVAQLPRWSPH